MTPTQATRRSAVRFRERSELLDFLLEVSAATSTSAGTSCRRDRAWRCPSIRPSASARSAAGRRASCRRSASSVSWRRAPVAAGTDTDSALADWGFDTEEVAALKATGAIA